MSPGGLSLRRFSMATTVEPLAYIPDVEAGARDRLASLERLAEAERQTHVAAKTPPYLDEEEASGNG